MAAPKSTSRTIYIDQSSAEVALDKLIKKSTQLQAAIDGGTLSGDKLNKKIAELDKTKSAIQDVQDQLSKGLSPTFLQVQNQVTQLRNELKRMSSDAPEFAAKFDAYKKASATLQDMKTKMDGVTESHSQFGKIFEHVFEGFAAYRIIEVALEKVKEFFSQSIVEAEKAEEANTKLKNILENIGRIDAFDRLKQKADDLAAHFKFLDSDDLINVEQQLITYGKLTENQISTLLPLIVNFSSKSKISLEESASVIIKALEGNSRALKEYGINLSGANTVSERFNGLMKDLKPRVEGAAEAFGESFTGSVATAKQELANVEEDLGNKMLPALTGFYKVISQTIEGLESIFSNVKNFFVDAGNAISFNAGLLKSYFKNGEAGALSYYAQASAIAAKNKEIADDQTALANIQVQVNSIVADAATKTIDNQKEIIKQNVALRDASLKTYLDVTAAGKANTEEAKKAALQYIQDFQTVDALQKSLAAQQDKRVLGVGGSDFDQKKYDELLNAALDFNKKLRDLQNEASNASKAADQKELDNIKHKYDEVIISYQEMQKKLKGTNIHLSLTIDQIKGMEDSEISSTIRKQMRALFDASQKEFDASQSKQYDDALSQSDKHFSELKSQQSKEFISGSIDYKEYQNNITSIDEQSNAKKIAIAMQYTATVDKAAVDVTKLQKEQLDQQTKDAIDAYNKQSANEKSVDDLVKSTALKDAQTKVDVAIKGSEQEFFAKKNYLDLQRQQEVKALEQQRADDLAKVKDDENRAGERIKINDAINTQISDTNARFDEQQKELHKQHVKEIVDAIASYATQITDIADLFNQAAANKENAALQAELKQNDAKKAAYKKMLDGKLLSQAGYDSKVAALDAEADKKKSDLEKKQFERSKKVQIAQAFINAATASVKVWADPGFPLAIALEALIATQLAAQVSVINSQKPSFARGGFLTGDAHAAGGMPVINRKTGRVEAEVEGGEVILSKKTVANNWDYINPLLHSSMNEGGRRISPFWQTRSYQAINFPEIQNTFSQKRFFDSGGVFAATVGNQQQATGVQTVVVKDDETKAVMMAVLNRLDNPVVPVINNSISLKQISDANAQQARIEEDATFK